MDAGILVRRFLCISLSPISDVYPYTLDLPYNCTYAIQATESSGSSMKHDLYLSQSTRRPLYRQDSLGPQHSNSIPFSCSPAPSPSPASPTMYRAAVMGPSYPSDQAEAGRPCPLDQAEAKERDLAGFEGERRNRDIWTKPGRAHRRDR
jgi:hypothetical protein